MRRRTARPSHPDRTDPHVDLHECPVCERDFVQPVSWEPVAKHAWWMFLRCGECGMSREVVVPNAAAERFESELHARAAVLAREARRLEGERLSAEVDAFVAALERDVVDAGDFYRYSAGL